MGMCDREAGTVSFTSSVGLGGRKLEHIAADPRIAVAYHTRQNSDARFPTFSPRHKRHHGTRQARE